MQKEQVFPESCHQTRTLSRVSMAKRILQTVLTLHTGGLERIVVDLIGHSSDDYEHVICCLEETGKMGDVLAGKGVPLFELGKRPGIRPGLVKKLGRIIREQSIDLVHTHNSAPAFYGGMAGRFEGVPVVHTKHGLNLHGQKLLNRVAHLFTDMIVAVSESAADLARSEGVADHRLKVVDNGIDVERFTADAALRSAERQALGIGDDAFVIGSLGRLSPEKNHELLVRTVHAIARNGDTTLVLAGDGPSRVDLEALAADLGCGDRVRFLGMITEPERFYPLLDVFVMPSKSEGLPVALLEAMASGVPTVVTRVGAMPHVVDGCGSIVDSEDMEALATELLRLKSGPHVRKVLATAGRQKVVAQYSVDRMVATYEDVYRRLLVG
jgi:glycosyltransferase involved in cell wall biosynthesis